MNRRKLLAEVVYRAKLPTGVILENDTLKPLYHAALYDLRSLAFENAKQSGYSYVSAVIEYGISYSEIDFNRKVLVGGFTESSWVCFIGVSYYNGHCHVETEVEF